MSCVRMSEEGFQVVYPLVVPVDRSCSNLHLNSHACEWLQVLIHVAKRLADLHSAGYAHRDLKPANVMWLPRENRWTLIDFGCAARIGATAPLAFTLAYAAPETVRAWRGGATQESAAAELDAWALGAMAVQLLSREPLFEAGSSLRDAVRAVHAARSEQPKPCGQARPAFGLVGAPRC